MSARLPFILMAMRCDGDAFVALLLCSCVVMVLCCYAVLTPSSAMNEVCRTGIVLSVVPPQTQQNTIKPSPAHMLLAACFAMLLLLLQTMDYRSVVSYCYSTD
jgi:hypothetical protein